MGLIERIEIKKFFVEIPNFERDYSDDIATGTMMYRKGALLKRPVLMVRIFNSEGVVGEYANWAPNGSMETAVISAKMALGRRWQERERIWRAARRANRPGNAYGLSYIDIALWDMAGKSYDAPLSDLLGAHRKRVVSYASCNNGDRKGNLSSKEAVAEYFSGLKSAGFQAFKMHSWNEGNRIEEAENVQHLRYVLGSSVDLMLDPACVFENLSDAIYVGKACSDAGYRWYEDPIRPLGVGAYQHRKLREAISIPVLQTEHVAGPEAKADFLLAGGTDLLRADCHYDLGITGCLKTMGFGESLGVSVEFHAPSPVHRHLIAAQQSETMYEVANVSPAMADPSPQIYTCGYSDSVETISSDGTLPVPGEPGVGVSYDYDLIQRNSIEEEILTLSEHGGGRAEFQDGNFELIGGDR